MESIEGMQAKALEEQQMEQQRQGILEQILEPEAKDRITRLALVKPEKARSVEDSLIRAAQTGQLKARVNDESLKKMLEQISDGGSADTGIKKKKIVIQRRRYGMDDGDDDDDSDLL